MKKKFLTAVFSLCAFCAPIAAQQVSVADVEAVPGETVSVTLNLTGGNDSYQSLSFDVAYPSAGFQVTEVSALPSTWVGNSIAIGPVTNNVQSIQIGGSNTLDDGEVGALLSVKIKVDESVEIGSYDLSLQNIVFEYGVDDHDNLGDVSFKINVVEAHTIMLDENSTTAPTAQSGVNVNVKRTINAGEWSTICLPFAMTADQCKAAFGSDVELGDFNGYETSEDGKGDITGITVKFNAATAIEANHPYIIKVSAPVSEFTVEGVDVDPQEAKIEFRQSRKLKGAFVGTYTADFDFYTEETSFYPLFMSGGKFYYATDKTRHMKAFRAYFGFEDLLTDFEKNYASAPIFISFNNDPTGINRIYDLPDYDSSVYDLSGRKLSNSKWLNGQMTNGLYITNGKKVVVKRNR
jgi:hypothetical protein